MSAEWRTVDSSCWFYGATVGLAAQCLYNIMSNYLQPTCGQAKPYYFHRSSPRSANARPTAKPSVKGCKHLVMNISVKMFIINSTASNKYFSQSSKAFYSGLLDKENKQVYKNLYIYTYICIYVTPLFMSPLRFAPLSGELFLSLGRAR